VEEGRGEKRREGGEGGGGGGGGWGWGDECKIMDQ